MLPVIDQPPLDAIETTQRGGDDGQPFVVHPSGRDRQCIRQQSATQRNGRAGREAAAQQDVKASPSVHALQFGT